MGWRRLHAGLVAASLFVVPAACSDPIFDGPCAKEYYELVLIPDLDSTALTPGEYRVEVDWDERPAVTCTIEFDPDAESVGECDTEDSLIRRKDDYIVIITPRGYAMFIESFWLDGEPIEPMSLDYSQHLIDEHGCRHMYGRAWMPGEM